MTDNCDRERKVKISKKNSFSIKESKLVNSGEKVKTRRTESESKKTPKSDRGKVKVAKESLEKQRINNVELLCPGYPCPSGSSPGYHYDVNL